MCISLYFFPIKKLLKPVSPTKTINVKRFVIRIILNNDIHHHQKITLALILFNRNFYHYHK
jgi:hypothetical protein